MTDTRVGSMPITLSRPAALLPRYVEIETSRKCNRACSWCPNGEHPARREQQLMDWPLYTQIIDQLGELAWDGWLAFHNYNEPLLNTRLLDEIAYAKSILPHAKPAIYTNGDALRRPLFDRLVEAGTEYIRVTRYPHRADTSPSYTAITKWLAQAGLDDDTLVWSFGKVRQGLSASVEVGRLRIEVISPQILGTYNTRGGSVTMLELGSARRTAPCLMTATSASIDYRGLMKMCCCVVPEVDEHARYVIGDLRTVTFVELWNSEQMAGYRDAHASADWSQSPACRSCTQPLPETRQ